MKSKSVFAALALFSSFAFAQTPPPSAPIAPAGGSAAGPGSPTAGPPGMTGSAADPRAAAMAAATKTLTDGCPAEIKNGGCTGKEVGNPAEGGGLGRCIMMYGRAHQGAITQSCRDALKSVHKQWMGARAARGQ